MSFPVYYTAGQGSSCQVSVRVGALITGLGARITDWYDSSTLLAGVTMVNYPTQNISASKCDVPETKISPFWWAAKYDQHRTRGVRPALPVHRLYSSEQWGCSKEWQSQFPCMLTSARLIASCINTKQTITFTVKRYRANSIQNKSWRA